MADYAVFAQGDLLISPQAYVQGGWVGSNNDITIQSNATLLMGVHGGGSINPGGDKGKDATIGSLTDFAEVIVNGNFDYMGTVYGDVHAGGDVDIRKGGKVLETTSAEGGNIYSAGKVKLSSQTVVDGDVVAAGSVNVHPSAVVHGTVTGNLGSTPTQLKTFSTVEMELETTFSAGGANITSDKSDSYAGGDVFDLDPGSYGAMDLGIHNDVYLRSGDYYFTMVDARHHLDLFLDLSTADPLNIFVEGNVRIGNNLNVFVKTTAGGGYTDVDNLSLADRQFASLVYMETHDSWRVQMYSDWFGTVYAVNEVSIAMDVAPGIEANVWGSLFSGGTLNIKEAGSLNYVRSYRFDPPVEDIDAAGNPEPVTSILALLGVGALGSYATRRRRA